MFVQASLLRSAANKSQKTSSFAVDFQDFARSETWILDISEAPGSPFFGFFGFLIISQIFLILGTSPPRKPTPFLNKNRDSDQLFHGLVLHCFWGARFFNLLWFWVPEDSILATFLALLWELWAFGKTVESVVTVVNFRGLTASRRSFFAGLGRGCVSMMSFSELYDSWLFWGSHFDAFKDDSLLKRSSENKYKKEGKRRARAKQVLPCGSL